MELTRAGGKRRLAGYGGAAVSLLSIKILHVYLSIPLCRGRVFWFIESGHGHN